MNSTVPSRWTRGIKYFNRKLVDHVTITTNDGVITFDAIAESEFFNDVYTTSISIDTINLKILGCSCTCEDFNSRHSQNNIFICNHIAIVCVYVIFNFSPKYLASSLYLGSLSFGTSLMVL